MTHPITALGFARKSAMRTKHYNVFMESLRQYVPLDVQIYQTIADKSFGENYNTVVAEMMAAGHKSFAIANDDIVLTPSTWRLMQEDWDSLHDHNLKPGIMATRCDYVRMGPQNVRFLYGGDTPRNHWESRLIETTVISPIIAIYSADAWVDFLPINWFSDDVQCHDIRKNGNTIWVSRAYCHHVGSQTMTVDTYQAEEKKTLDWFANNRPDLLSLFNNH